MYIIKNNTDCKTSSTCDLLKYLYLSQVVNFLGITSVIKYVCVLFTFSGRLPEFTESRRMKVIKTEMIYPHLYMASFSKCVNI